MIVRPRVRRPAREAETNGSTEQPPLVVGRRGLAQMLDISLRQLDILRSAGRLLHPISSLGHPKWLIAEAHAWVAAGCPPPTRWARSRERTKAVKR